MSSSSLDYINTQNGVTHYDFARIDSPKICQKIEYSCSDKSSMERFKAIAYIATSIVLSFLLGFSFLNFIAAQVLTIYFFSSDAWRKSEHYANMHEKAGFRLAELQDQSRSFSNSYSLQ